MSAINKFISIIGLVLLCITSGGCSILESPTESQTIDPPVQSSDERASKRTMTVYLLDSWSHVVPITMSVSNPGRMAELTLNALAEGNPIVQRERLPEGFRAPLPKDTVVKAIHYSKEDKVVTVDFSEHFVLYNIENERKMVEAVVWALTELPGIEYVQIQVTGKQLEQMPLDGMPLNQPLSRTMGINLQKNVDTDWSRSLPVTIYFRGQTDQRFDYFVPVTSWVSYKEDPVQSVMMQLLEGPDFGSQMKDIFAEDIHLTGVSQTQSEYVVGLKTTTSDSTKQVSQTAMQAIALSYHLLDRSSQVRLNVHHGSATETLSMENVIKPTAINMISP